MAKKLMGSDLGARVCQMLGVDPSNVTRASILMEPARPVVVSIDHMLLQDGEGLAVELKRYNLVEIDDDA